MIKNKKIIKITILSLLIVSAIGSASVMASSKADVQNKVEKLTDEFNSKKSDLEKTRSYSTTSAQATAVKQLGIKIADLKDQTETEEEYRARLEKFIIGCRRGLEDSKKEQKIDYQKSRQDFIDKMEKKLDKIEAEMKANDAAKNSLRPDSVSDENSSNTSSSKELLEKLLDRSDVDN